MFEVFRYFYVIGVSNENSIWHKQMHKSFNYLFDIVISNDQQTKKSKAKKKFLILFNDRIIVSLLREFFCFSICNFARVTKYDGRIQSLRDIHLRIACDLVKWHFVMHIVDPAFSVESECSRSKYCSFCVVKQSNICTWHDIGVVHEHAETIPSHVT